MQDLAFSGGLSVQDADLLARLNTYCDHLVQRVEQGQGWLIFNSSRDRGARILRLLLARLDEYRAHFNLCHLPCGYHPSIPKHSQQFYNFCRGKLRRNYFNKLVYRLSVPL